MKNTVFSLLLMMGLASLLFFPACKESDTAKINQLVDTTWSLQTMQFIESMVIQVSDPYTIVFNADNTLSMTVDCNTCFGSYTSSPGGAINFSAPTCTEAYCGADSQENNYRYALLTAFSYEVVGDTLRISFQNTASNSVGYFTYKKTL